MFTTFQVSVGEGSFLLKSVVIKTENGIHIYVGGGDKTHIGTTVISQPRPSLTGDGSTSCTTSLFNLLGHKDDQIALPIAEEICKHFKETTVVTAGVHINNATCEEIEKLKWHGVQIISRIIEIIEKQLMTS